MEPNTKICPFCGELIKSDAQKCRYCREWLNEVQEIKPVTPAAVIKKVEPVIIPVVNEVKTDISPEAHDASQEILPEKIPDITSEEFVPAAKTYPPGTIVLFDGKKVKTKLKNFYKNRFLPFYQNSYLLFFILTTLICGCGNLLKNIISLRAVGRFGYELLYYHSFGFNILNLPNMIAFTMALAAGMLFITVRDDETKLRRSVQSIILPVIAVTGVIAVCGLTAPEQLAQLTYRQELLPKSELFCEILRIGVITFAITTLVQFLMILLIVRVEFGKLLLCILAGLVAEIAIVVGVSIGIVTHYSIILSVPVIELILLLFFCRKLLFTKFRFDLQSIRKFAWYVICIFGALYFCNIFDLITSLWCKGVGKFLIFSSFYIMPIAACLWGAYLSKGMPKFSFYLKTLLFCAVIAYLYIILFCYSGLFHTDMNVFLLEHGWQDGEFIKFCMLLATLAIVKSVSNAYYCSTKWYFMLVLNMFLLLWGSLAFLKWCLPGSGGILQLIIRESNLPIENGWIFLLLSFAIDLFALFHAIYSCKKEIVLNKKIHIACNVAAVLLILWGFISIDRCLLNSRLYVLNMQGSGIELKQTP